VEPQENFAKNSAKKYCNGGNEAAALDVFFSSAATLREVKARKTPSASSNVGGVFNYGANGLRPHAIASHAIPRV
jgi:hypothetical protein